MKKKYLVLQLGLLALSGCRCGKARKAVCSPDKDAVTVVQSDDTTSHRARIDEREGAFTLQEVPNPFEPAQEPVASEVTEPLWEAAIEYEFEPVYFGFDQYKVSASQKPALKRDVERIKKALHNNAAAVVVVEGHACNSAGSESYNIMLSDRRAQMVQAYLVEQGIDRNRLQVVGRGYQKPVVVSGTREQQAPNRRVEFLVVLNNR
jgi:outer membrane protein OmpA-like peptidoglycan-associated protein